VFFFFFLHKRDVYFLDNWIRSRSGNTAIVVSVSGHFNVTSITPRSTPGVLDQPKVLAAFGTKTNSQNSVVEGSGRASGFIVNSGGIELERLLGSINGNRGRGLVDSVQQSSFISLRNIVEAGQGSSAICSVVSAGVRASGGVWVRSFSINSMVGDDILEGLVHEATIASLVSLGGRAIDQILLGEAWETSGFQEVGTFSGTSGGETPATSALLLVLNSSDGSFGSPVPRGWGGRRCVCYGNCCLGDIHSVGPSSKFLTGFISEFVQGNSKSFGSGVVGSDELEV